jgi:hypothetical protein
MNDMSAPLFRVTYRMQRGDHLARVAVLTQRPLLRALTLAAAYYGILLLLLLVMAGGFPAFLSALAELATTPRFLEAWPFLLAGLVFVAPAAWIGAPMTAMAFRRGEVTGREVTLDVTTAGLAVSQAASAMHVGWAAMRRLIETPDHLFVQLSPREAVIVPRRAFADEERYRALAAFLRARTGLRTRRR